MALGDSNRLGAATEQKMRDLYSTLSEKDRRRFAAFEGDGCGHGGRKYGDEGLGGARKTIER